MPDKMMRAVRYHQPGPPEVLQVEQVPIPAPGEAEVLVRVYAAGVNPVDWKIRRGYIPVPLPAIPGIDLAGVVAAVGAGVSDFREGDAVYGAGSGAYAEYAVAAAANLAPKPDRLTYEEAATVPVGARTAWAGLFDAANLQAGQRILIQGAAGGVGIFAVQLARWKGAHVLGTASAANLEFIRSLGCETAIDYHAARFEDVVQDVDVVFDAVGGETLERSYQVVKPGGVLETIVGQPSEEKAKEHDIRVARVGPPAPVAGPILRKVGELVQSGQVVTVVQKVLPLEDARQAHELSETGHGRGHIVLRVGS